MFIQDNTTKYIFILTSCFTKQKTEVQICKGKDLSEIVVELQGLMHNLYDLMSAFLDYFAESNVIFSQLTSFSFCPGDKKYDITDGKV